MNHQKARLLLNDAEKCLYQYNAQLAEDNFINMSEFEVIVHNFCDEIGKMPQDEAKIYANSMVALSDSLEALSVLLTNRRDEIKDKIIELNTSSQASNAYQNLQG